MPLDFISTEVDIENPSTNYLCQNFMLNLLNMFKKSKTLSSWVRKQDHLCSSLPTSCLPKNQSLLESYSAANKFQHTSWLKMFFRMICDGKCFFSVLNFSGQKFPSTVCQRWKEIFTEVYDSYFPNIKLCFQWLISSPLILVFQQMEGWNLLIK